jgi:hypothetical protein
MVVALSNVYVWGAQNCGNYTTMGALYNAMTVQATTVNAILPTNITKVQTVISSELLTALPNQTTSTFTPSVVATEFNRIAAILKTLPTSKRKGI